MRSSAHPFASSSLSQTEVMVHQPLSLMHSKCVVLERTLWLSLCFFNIVYILHLLSSMTEIPNHCWSSTWITQCNCLNPSWNRKSGIDLQSRCLQYINKHNVTLTPSHIIGIARYMSSKKIFNFLREREKERWICVLTHTMYFKFKTTWYTYFEQGRKCPKSNCFQKDFAFCLHWSSSYYIYWHIIVTIQKKVIVTLT